MKRAAHWFFLSGLLLAGILLTHYAPPVAAQFTGPALPGQFTDIATPSAPLSGTKVYTKGGKVCSLDPSAAENCTGAGGGTTVSVGAPYITVGGTKYVGATMWPFTAFFSGSFLDTVTSTLTAGANGSELITCACNSQSSWYATAATTSIEAEFQAIATTTISGAQVDVAGLWSCDTTNGKVYGIEAVSSGNGGNQPIGSYIQTSSFTLAGCTGTPSAGAVRVGGASLITNGIAHFKLVKSGGTLLFESSNDAGQTYSQVDSVAVGTLTKNGIDIRTTGNFTVAMTVLSVSIL